MRYYELYSQHVEFPRGTNKEGFVECVCPFDENHDAQRSSNAGIDLSTGVFNCYKCGTMSPARFLHSRIPAISFIQATAILDEYRREHKINEKIETFVKTRIRDSRLDKLYEKSQKVDLNDIPMVVEYAEGRGLDMATLKSLGLGWLEAGDTHWKRSSLVFPYVMDGNVVGIRYRDAHGSKGGEPNCHFTIWGIDDLDSEESTVAVVVEGESDRLRTWQELNRTGFPCTVVSTPTAAFRHEWRREFAGFHKVILITQDDEAALGMIKQFKEAMQDRGEVLTLPWKRKQFGKDVCDWLNYNSGEELALRLEALVGDSKRRFMVGSEFAVEASQPRQYLIDGLFARRQVAVMAGPPKNFKTWLAISMIRCLITGEELCGIPGMNGALEPNERVLFIEEEGDAEELYQRMELVMGNTDWKGRVVMGHHLGVRLDEESWVQRVEKVIADYNIAFVIIDPFQRVHGGDENSATETGPVWLNIHRFTTRFKHLGVLLLHHFNKSGDLNLGWNALRGSSRMAGEVDLGIFVERRPKSEGPGAKVKFDGRTIPYLETPDGKDIFRFRFDDSRGLVFDTGGVAIDKRRAFELETKSRGKWTLVEASKHLGVSAVTIRSWCEKSEVVSIESRGKGLPSLITWVPGARMSSMEEED